MTSPKTFLARRGSRFGLLPKAYADDTQLRLSPLKLSVLYQSRQYLHSCCWVMMYMTFVSWLYCTPGETWGTRLLRMRPAWLTTTLPFSYMYSSLTTPLARYIYSIGEMKTAPETLSPELSRKAPHPPSIRGTPLDSYRGLHNFLFASTPS
jgi:hypothetical protein